MERLIEVEVDDTGQVHPLNPSETIPAGRAVLVLDTPSTHECYVLSESALAKDWLRPEEDEAWADFQLDK